jgi:hypothetical protein
MAPTSLSLKAFLEGLAPIVGLSPAALYERQRALTRLGLLTPEKGKGPNSGVRATPESVTTLLIAILLADGLSEIDARVGVLLNAKPLPRTRCVITGAANFGDAIIRVIKRLAQPSSPSTSEFVKVSSTGIEVFAVSHITVHRQRLLGTIVFDERGRATSFGKIAAPPAFEVAARIEGHALIAIASRLASHTTTDSEGKQ